MESKVGNKDLYKVCQQLLILKSWWDYLYYSDINTMVSWYKPAKPFTCRTLSCLCSNEPGQWCRSWSVILLGGVEPSLWVLVLGGRWQQHGKGILKSPLWYMGQLPDMSQLIWYWWPWSLCHHLQNTGKKKCHMTKFTCKSICM